MASWPATIPQEFMADSFTFNEPDNLLRSSVDQGPAKVRRRTSSNAATVNGSMMMSPAELTTFRAWYNNNISYGANSFDWVHPLTGANATMRLSAQPKYTPASGDLTQVDLTMEVLP